MFTPEKTSVSKKLFIYLLLLIVILLCSSTGYFFYQYRKLSQKLTKTKITDQEETQGLVKNIGKFMLLPKDETPTVATVTDINKLKDQSFFKNASNGNKVLIYPNSKLAIIYDPKAKLIINVGPINFSQQVQKIRIALRNGTNVVGLTNKIEAEIKKSFPEADIVLKEQDKNKDYQKTIVVVLNDSLKDTATSLAKTLNSDVNTIPEGETKPSETDILIIVGKDKS